MNYAALIQNRKSVREFKDKVVPFKTLEKIKNYYQQSVRSLIPDIPAELYFFGTDARRPWRALPVITISWWARPSIWCCCPGSIPRRG